MANHKKNTEEITIIDADFVKEENDSLHLDYKNIKKTDE